MSMTSPTLVLQVVRTLAARILYQLLVRQGSLSQQKVLRRMLMELYSSTFSTATALAPPHTFNIQATFCAVQMCGLYERPITQNMNYQSWGRKCYAVLIPTGMELVSQRIKGSRGSREEISYLYKIWLTQLENTTNEQKAQVRTRRPVKQIQYD